MSLDDAVARVKNDIGSSGDFLLASRLMGFKGSAAVQQLFDIIIKELIPQCVGMKDLHQLLAYLDHLFKVAGYSGDHNSSVIVFHMLLQIYDRLRDLDKSFCQQSESPFGSIRSWLLQVLIPQWGQTPDQEEAIQIFKRVRKTAKETDRQGLDEIKELIRKHDGNCPPRQIELAIISAEKDLPSENLRELIVVLSHRWVKELDPEQIAFLAHVGSWSSMDTGTYRPLVYGAILRATDQIREACKAAQEIFIKLAQTIRWDNAKITCLSPGEVWVRVDFKGDPGDEEQKQSLRHVVTYIKENPDLHFRELTCRVFVGSTGGDGVFEDRIVWN